MTTKKFKMFVQNGCEYCEEAEKLILKERPKCKIQRIDINKNPKLVDKFNLTGTPTILNEKNEEVTLKQMLNQCKLSNCKPKKSK